MILSSSIEALSLWIQKEVDKQSFATISTIVQIHDGKIAFIERSVTEKVKPIESIGGHYEKKK